MLLRHRLGAAYGILSLMTVAFVLPVGLDYGQFSEDTTKSSWENKCYPCTVRGLGTLDGTHCPRASGLQCYGCNIIVGTKYVDMGCSNPEVITCSHSHQGFKHRFCIKTESVVLGILLTSGCATSRHCQQQELPGVRIHCCDTDLCNGSPRSALPHYTLASCCLLVSSLIMAFFLL